MDIIERLRKVAFDDDDNYTLDEWQNLLLEAATVIEQTRRSRDGFAERAKVNGKTRDQYFKVYCKAFYVYAMDIDVLTDPKAQDLLWDAYDRGCWYDPGNGHWEEIKLLENLGYIETCLSTRLIRITHFGRCVQAEAVMDAEAEGKAEAAMS